MDKQQDHVEMLNAMLAEYPAKGFTAEKAALTAAISALTVDEAAIERALAAWFAMPSQTSDQERMCAAIQAAIQGA